LLASKLAVDQLRVNWMPQGYEALYAKGEVPLANYVEA
jgi:hypothetical protein